MCWIRTLEAEHYSLEVGLNALSGGYILVLYVVDGNIGSVGQYTLEVGLNPKFGGREHWSLGFMHKWWMRTLEVEHHALFLELNTLCGGYKRWRWDVLPYRWGIML